MLSSSQRLSVEQFDPVMKKGRIFHSPFFLMRLLKVDGPSRFSAVAPQKVCKTAVQRNYMRRKMYEAMKVIGVTNVVGSQAILFAKQPAKTADLASLTADMRTLFVNAGLIK